MKNDTYETVGYGCAALLYIGVVIVAILALPAAIVGAAYLLSR